MGLPDGGKSFKIGFSRLDTIPAVTDRQPASQPASHVAVAYTALTTSRGYNKMINTDRYIIMPPPTVGALSDDARLTSV